MTTKNRQELPKTGGLLWVVATPIGNLEDCSPRAIRVLREADGILCEDTRVTLKLLHALGIDRPLTGVLERADQHSTPAMIERWVSRIQNGERLAMVSDAGTPAISDPGAELVARLAEAGEDVVVIPGPSALAAFLSGAGFTSGSPLFRGFFPRKDSDRESEWEKVRSLPFSVAAVWFESPERIESTIEFLAGKAPDLQGVVAKELTKRHENFYRGCLKDLTSHILSAREAGEIRGEWVIGMLIPEREASASAAEKDDWMETLRDLVQSGVSASRAAKEVSQVFGISKKIAYSEAVNLAKSAGSVPEAEEDRNN